MSFQTPLLLYVSEGRLLAEMIIARSTLRTKTRRQKTKIRFSLQLCRRLAWHVWMLFPGVSDWFSALNVFPRVSNIGGRSPALDPRKDEEV